MSPLSALINAAGAVGAIIAIGLLLFVMWFVFASGAAPARFR